MSKQIVQGTDEWHQQRLGCFTSSEIHRLMTGPAGELSVGAKTYCEEKLDEILTGYAKTFENKFVEYGKATEEKARLAIEEFYGKDTMICGLITHPELTYYKGSLDSVIDLDGLFAVEIKCPFYPKEHRNNIKESVDAKTFKQKSPQYYWQVQSNIVIGKCLKGLFVTYFPNHGTTSLVCRELEKDEEGIELMLKKLKMARVYMEQQAEEYGIKLES